LHIKKKNKEKKLGMIVIENSSQFNGMTKVLLVDGDDKHIITINNALKIAEERKLNLVIVSTSGKYPVAKIFDYGKFLYQKKKEKKEKQKKTGNNIVKIVQLGQMISDNDLEHRMRMLKEFLSEGFIVQVKIRMKGRQNAHPELCNQLFDRVIEDLKKEFSVAIDKPLKREGRAISATIRVE